jgi:hypothetical protein
MDFGSEKTLEWTDMRFHALGSVAEVMNWMCTPRRLIVKKKETLFEEHARKT